MKIATIAITIILILSATLWLTWRNYKQPASSQTNAQSSAQPSATPTITQIIQTKAPNITQSGSTRWGVNIDLFALAASESVWSKTQTKTQLDLAAELGATDVIATVSTNLEITDDFISQCLEHKLNPVLVLNPSGLFTSYTYDSAYQYAKSIAARYNGRVTYYQLGDDVSAPAILDNVLGYKITDYDDTKYAVVRDAVKGLSDGIYASDKNIKRIVASSKLGVGVLKRLIGDKVYFDIAGWSWFSDAGNDLVGSEDEISVSISDEVSKLNKPLWVTKFNLRDGTQNNNAQEQANYIGSFTTNVLGKGNVSGLFIFRLTDLCSSLASNDGNMGIVSLTQNSDNTCSIKERKTAFNTYRDLIKSHQ